MEINLLANYPKSNRNVIERGIKKTEADRIIARLFGKAFFDGSRDQGYGGYSYHRRFWEPVIPDFQKHYHLTETSTVLDIGCAKGFMLYDMARLIPGISVKGIDISEYAINNAMEVMQSHCQVACATNLPFPDKSFNTVISVTAFHNFNDMEKALLEIKRVSKNNNIAITFLKKSKKINEFRKILKKYFKFKEIDCDKDILFVTKVI